MAVSREDRAGVRERFEVVDLDCASVPRLNSRRALSAASGAIVLSAVILVQRERRG